MVRHSLEVPHSQQTKIERLARKEAREGTDVSVKRNKGYGCVICFEKKREGIAIWIVDFDCLRRGYGGRAHRGGRTLEKWRTNTQEWRMHGGEHGLES